MMRVTCPNCDSNSIRHSRLAGLTERISGFLGWHWLRCRDCNHRFRQRVWKFAEGRFAHCPTCYRTDLTTWSEEHYRPRPMASLLLALGAKPLRCEPCRENFVSFRPVKQRYRFRRSRSSATTASVLQSGD